MAAPGPTCSPVGPVGTDVAALPSEISAADVQLPPFNGRVRTTRHQGGADSSKSSKQLAEDAYAVSPSTPLLMTKMQHNAFIWGDVACTTPVATSSDTALCNPAGAPNQALLSIGLSTNAPTGATVRLCGVPAAGRWAALSLGDGHAAGITCRGELLTWGSNSSGQSGRASEPPSGSRLPLQVRMLAGVQVRAVACGDQHTLAITTAGVMAWGCNGSGQCGLGKQAASSMRRPEVVPALRGVSVGQLAAGRAHSLALTSASQVLSWGDGTSGQLGLGDRRPRDEPVGVEGLWALPVVQIAAGDAHSAAVTSSGHAFIWGCNYFGQLGLLPEPCAEHPPAEGCGTPQAAAPGSGAVNSRAGAMQHSHISHRTAQSNGVQHPHQNPHQHQHSPSGLLSPRTPRSPYSSRTPRTPGSARRAAIRRNGGAARPNPQWLLAMVEMGIPSRHARIALEETGNAGVEVATEWLFAADRSAILEEEEEPPGGASPGTAAGARSAGGSAGVARAASARGPGHQQQPSGAGNVGNSSSSRGDRDEGWRVEDVDWWEDLMVLEPRRVPLKGVRQLAAGSRHTVAVTDCGVYSWGEGAAGALGLGDCDDRDMPCRVDHLLGTSAQPAHDPSSTTSTSSANAASRSQPSGAAVPHAYVRSRLGSDGFSASSCSPVAVQRVACGAHHTLFLAQDGSIFWCGTMPCDGPTAAAGSAAAAATRPRCDSEPDAATPAAAAQQQQRVPRLHMDGATPGVSSAGSEAGRVVSSVLPRRLDLGLGTRAKLSSCGTSPASSSASSAPVAYDVVARGSSSAVLMCNARELPQVLGPTGPLLLDQLRSAIESASQARAASGDVGNLSASLKAVTAGVRMVLSSPAAVSASFGSRSGMGLDGQLLENVLSSVRQLFATRPGDSDGVASTVAELHRYSVVAALQGAAATLVDDLAAHVRLLGTPERAQVLLAALQHPLLSEPLCARQLLPKLVATVIAAPPVVRTWLVRWWAEYPGPLLASRVVQPLQAFLTRELGATKKLTTTLMNVIKVLARVEEAASLSTSLPPEAFYNTLISDKLDVQDHYSAWRQAQELAVCRDPPKDAPFSFCSYPFLLNARAKSHLLHLEARFQMEQSVAHARMEVQLYGGSAAARRRAEEGLVLVKSVAGSGSGRSRPQRYLASSLGAASGSSTSDVSTSGTSTSDRSSGSPSTSTGSSIISSGGSGSSGGVSGPLRSLFALLRRHRSSPSGAKGDDTRAKDQRAKPQAGGSFELPSPAQCPVPGVHSDMCILRVRRTHLVDDALAEVGRQARRDLLKPLRVHFIGEEGIDAGGVKKEFFALLVERMLSPDYGMMVYDEASRMYWFNRASLEPPESYFLMGLVLGLAVYNRVLLAFPAPLLLYQKLRGGRELGLRDLEGWQPELARGLRQLLEYDGPELMADVFGLNFSVDVDCFGRIETVPLKPGGDLIPVTEDNRTEYVSLMAAWHMGGSVGAQFDAFAAGFRVLCEGPAMSLFNAQELERLVCGNPRLDFVALRDAARYDGGYTRDTPVVRWLWDVVLQELSVEDQRAFLKFFTGSDRSPIGGLGSLRPVIQRDGPDSHKLPTAHTCFNTLLLPEYCNRTMLTSLLRLAINNSEGFGLQ